MAAARQRGNLSSHAPKPPVTTEPLELFTSAESVRVLISATLDKLQHGDVDRGVANGIVYGCQVALRAIDIAALEARIRALEEARRPAK